MFTAQPATPVNELRKARRLQDFAKIEEILSGISFEDCAGEIELLKRLCTETAIPSNITPQIAARILQLIQQKEIESKDEKKPNPTDEELKLVALDEALAEENFPEIEKLIKELSIELILLGDSPLADYRRVDAIKKIAFRFNRFDLVSLLDEKLDCQKRYKYVNGEVFEIDQEAIISSADSADFKFPMQFAVEYAMQTGHADGVLEIIKHKFSAGLEYALAYFAKCEWWEFVKALILTNKIDNFEIEIEGGSVVHFALLAHQRDIIQILACYGALILQGHTIEWLVESDPSAVLNGCKGSTYQIQSLAENAAAAEVLTDDISKGRVSILWRKVLKLAPNNIAIGAVLLTASQAGAWDIVKQLLPLCCQPSRDFMWAGAEENAFVYAARAGQLDIVKEMVECYPAILQIKFQFGEIKIAPAVVEYLEKTALSQPQNKIERIPSVGNLGLLARKKTEKPKRRKEEVTNCCTCVMS